MEKVSSVIMKKIKVLIPLILISITVGTAWVFFSSEPAKQPYLSPYPDGKNFAFTVTDDPDWNRLEKIKPVYEFLTEVGLGTTIAVWAKEATRSDGAPDIEGFFNYGDTLQHEPYRDYILELKRRGFEIALHTVSGGNDRRQKTIEGYEDFKAIIGEYPKINIMHSNNLENVYWGRKVFKSSIARWAFRNLIGIVYAKARFPFGGEDPNSPYFWGDILKEKTKYVRLWGTSDINTLKFNPSMPYHDPDRPYVNYWFSFSDGYNLDYFNKLISDKNIERLVKERGACIVYTHFAGFCKKTKEASYQLDEYFRNQIEKIAGQKDGWFVPASVFLDRLLAMKNVSLFDMDSAIIIVNSNDYPVAGVTLMVSPGALLHDFYGNICTANDEGEIVIDRLTPGSSITFFRQKNPNFIRNPHPDRWEHFNMVLRRTLIWIFSHKE